MSDVDAPASYSVEDNNSATLSANIQHHLSTTSGHVVTWAEVPRIIGLGDTQYLDCVKVNRVPACMNLHTIDLGAGGDTREPQGLGVKAPEDPQDPQPRRQNVL